MSSLDNAQKHIRCGKMIISNIEHYKKEISKGTRDCDKFDLGFNIDDRFSSFKMTLSLDSWLGYYGSSSCSTAISILDSNIFKASLVEELNSCAEEILMATANRILKKASQYKNAALEELNRQIAIIEALDNDEEAVK